MEDDEPIQPGAMGRTDPRGLELRERNAFYGSLSIKAKERFLEALEAAAERGLSDQESWREAVIAAETAYPSERSDVHTGERHEGDEGLFDRRPRDRHL